MNNVFIQKAMVCLGIVISQTFLFCYFGHEITHHFDNIPNLLYCTNWYKLPLKMQRDSIMLMMMIAQKSVYLRGSGNIDCTLDVFRRVSLFIIINLHRFENNIHFVIDHQQCI